MSIVACRLGRPLTTVTTNEHVPTFWQSSDAVQMTVVGPKGKVLPEGGLQLTAGEAGLHVSVAVAVNVTTAPAGLAVATLIGPGHETTGLVVSTVHV